MKLLLLVLLLLPGAFQGARHSHDRLARYYWNPDTLRLVSGGKPYLKLQFKSAIEDHCHLAFRVFLLRKGQQIPACTDHPAYLGTRSLGMSCEGTFLFPVPERLSKLKETLVFTVVPLDAMARQNKADLRKEVWFRVVIR